MSRWIILEDEPDLYDYLLQFSSMFDVDGLGFSNAEQALAWIDEVDHGLYTGELPVLALLDYRMPDQDLTGGMVAERLRQSPALSNIAIVLMSAYTKSDPRIRDYGEAGIVDLLLDKPLPKINVLRETLLAQVRKRGFIA